jgi:DNA-binding transcriptional ArsR family regulator
MPRRLPSFCVEGACFVRENPAMPKTTTDCTDILKALADRSRMRIVKALLAETHGVNALGAALGISQYNVSKHLRILREAGIVDVEPSGTRREYFIAPALRERLKNEGPVLDFGCCTFRFDQLPD